MSRTGSLLIAVMLVLLAAAGPVTAQQDTTAVPKEEAATDTAAVEDTGEKDLVGESFGLPGRIGAAIARTPKGELPGNAPKHDGTINPDAPEGFAGIPGAPEIEWWIAILWAIWVGWIFSTVGAFGGIMAGVGHITIFGLGDYARSFKQTNPVMNKLLTDTIRVSNQFLVGLSALVTSTNYARKGQLVLPLGLTLGLGSVAGALLVPWLTAGRVNLSDYLGWFGVIVFVIGGFLLWQVSPAGGRYKSKAIRAAKEFEQSVKQNREAASRGVKVTRFGLFRVTFTFYGVEFGFNPLLPLVGGFVVAGVASFLGIGGGFLYVPFMTSIVGLPMFLVAGTSALCVLIGMVVSVFTYVAVKGTFVAWGLIGLELVGIFIGAMIGPRTQRLIPDRALKIIFVILAVYVGLRYFSQGFFGTSWVPPY